MPAAYLDTSVMIAIAFGEPAGKSMARKLKPVTRLYSSNLLEAEFRAAAWREGHGDEVCTVLRPLRWVMPSRPLEPEFRRVLEHGYVRGADLWHLASALFLAPEPGQLAFYSLDRRQAEVARKLGFVVPR